MIKLSQRDRAQALVNLRRWLLKPAALRRMGRGARVSPAIEGAYITQLREYSRKCSAAILGVLDLPSMFRADESTVSRMRAAVRAIPRPDPKRMIAATDAANLAAMTAQFRPIVGVPLWQGVSPEVRQVLSASLRDNIALIKSIPTEQLARVEEVLTESLKAGSRVEVVSKRLQEVIGIGERRAELIATDQVGKINGQLTEARATEAGMDAYIWRTSGGGGATHGDERVRPRHRQLDGTKQKFSKPPYVDLMTGERGNPGTPIRCRCTAEPDVLGLLEALEGG